jgi:glutamate dehydrogenase (NADP+)
MPLNEEELEEKMKALYDNIDRTATEFNARGDLVAGTDIASFLRVADAMLAHGSV